MKINIDGADSGSECSHGIAVANVSDVSEVYVASIFWAEVCRVFLCIRYTCLYVETTLRGDE
jgi:hypothetical protein